MVKQTTVASLEEIGRLFGGRHHTTVLHSINKIEGMLKSDEGLNNFILQSIDAVAN
jgi:chromosomal replication initiator protein